MAFIVFIAGLYHIFSFLSFIFGNLMTNLTLRNMAEHMTRNNSFMTAFYFTKSRHAKTTILYWAGLNMKFSLGGKCSRLFSIHDRFPKNRIL